MNSKLHHNLIELEEAEVITSEISHDIRNYYKQKSTNSPNRLFVIFGVLGGLLIGLGVILLLAHNWDDFTRATKTIWAFVPLVLGQLLAGYSLFKKRSAAWKETAATFLYFGIGASISLVSQVYNIPGSMSSFLLTWIVLGAPLIYLLRSHAAALLHLIFVTSYACNVGYFNDAIPWGYLIMLAWILPFYYKQLRLFPDNNVTGIYHWLLPLSAVISLGGFVSGADTFGFVLYVCLFGLFYSLGKLPFFTAKRLRVNGYLLLGSLGTVTVLLITSFSWMWDDAPMVHVNDLDAVMAFILVVATVGVMIYSCRLRGLKSLNFFQFAFLLFIIIYASAYIDTDVSMMLTNLLVFTLGIVTIVIGVKQERFSILNYGLLIITVLIACRFFDTDLSFVIRGLLFVAVGVGFFFTNYVLFKKQKEVSHE